MPMIDVVTNVTVSKEAEERLARGLGEAIALIPGKSEKTLMLRLDGDNTMYFAGEKEGPAAYIRVDVFGHAEEAVYQRFGAAVSALVAEQLSVDRKRMYLTVREIPTWVVDKG